MAVTKYNRHSYHI